MFHFENAIFKSISICSHQLWLVFIAVLGLYIPASASCTYLQDLQSELLEVGNLLSWRTQTETENAVFLIQRSLDGLAFSTIGEISGAGNSLEEQSYRFLDVETGALRVLYRLVQVNEDGLGTPSVTIVTNRITPSNFVITALERTKVERWFKCTLESALTTQGKFTIHNKYDEVVDNGTIDIETGQNQLAINLENLPTDTYLIVFEAAAEMEQVHVVLMDND